MASYNQVPSTPRVISPSPTPSDSSARDGYFAPVTRSVSRAKARMSSQAPISEDSSSDPDMRARSRSRESSAGRRTRMSGLPSTSTTAVPAKGAVKRRKAPDEPIQVANGHLNGGINGTANGHLSPLSAGGKSYGYSYWRELSRSPSPLGLIPIHTQWRSFIHRHEIPRKVLHVSIGFLTLYLYSTGTQPSSIHPILLSALIPIASVDILRHRYPALNRLYIRLLGALMRESEVQGYNGVIWYLLGAWLTLRFAPKDVGVMGVLLLSWCDTAASTFGRLWGRYTPRIRRGKSLAGSLAAAVVGLGTAWLFWGFVAPLYSSQNWDVGENAFAFQASLQLPEKARGLLGWGDADGRIEGALALGVMSLWAGFVGAASEAVDLFGWDDNLTIPVLCGAGLWGFLKILG